MKNPLWERLPAWIQSRVDELIAVGKKISAVIEIHDNLDEPRPGSASACNYSLSSMPNSMNPGSGRVRR